jgi:beta-phosphoglucomutase
MKKIKAILFDMDGVLIDAKEWHYEAMNKALGFFGAEISRFDHLVTFDGLPTMQKLKMLTLQGKVPEGLYEIIYRLKQKYTMQMITNKCRPTFNHQFAIARLKGEGYKLAVCSNSIRKSVESMIEQAGLDEYFDLYVSNQDVSKGKPDPEMYLKAMTEFGLKPEECLILEDNEKGIEAAKASGGHLLKIGTVDDVTLQNIKRRISEIENN